MLLFYFIFLLFFFFVLLFLNFLNIALIFCDFNLFILNLGLLNYHLFLFLVVFVSILILFYSSYYMNNELFFSYYIFMMFIFMLSMFFLLCSLNMMTLLLSWEGLGISSFFLVNFYITWESYSNSLITLMTMRFGDFFLFMMMSSVLFLNSSFLIKSVWCLDLMGLLFIIFSFTKSAQLPFSGWLPLAMSAPTPTSALVHSSTLVTAGLVVMMIFSNLLLNNFYLSIMLWFGFFTMMIGSFMALFETSVKKLVAFSTLSQMGLGMMAYGFGNFYAGFMNLIAHGLAKSLLFIQVGYLMHLNMSQQNTRKWKYSLSGEGLTMLHIMVSLFSLCGISFFSGMLSKEGIIELINVNSWYFFMYIFMLLSIFLTFFYSFILYSYFFSVYNINFSLKHSSLFLLFVSFIESLFVIFFFSWLILNISFTFFSMNYTESLLPLFMLFFFVVLSFYLIFNLFNFLNFSFFISVFNSASMYTWLSFNMPYLMFLMNYFYIFLNNIILIMYSLKVMFLNSGKFNFFVFVFIFLFFFVWDIMIKLILFK